MATALIDRAAAHQFETEVLAPGMLPLDALKNELQRQKKGKTDFDAASEHAFLEARYDGNGPARMTLAGVGEFDLMRHAHGQIAERWAKGRKFYDHLLTNHPLLWSQLFSGLMQREPARLFVRTLFGNIRAVCSDSYLPLDYWDMLLAIVPSFEAAGLKPENIKTSALTESHMYIEVVARNWEARLDGDVIRGQVTFGNSEVAAGSVKMEAGFFTTSCDNSLILDVSRYGKDYSQYQYRKIHAGGRASKGEYSVPKEWLADETRQAQDRATWLEIRDTARGMLTNEAFQKLLGVIEGSAGVKVTKPQAAVEKLAERFSFSEEEQATVLDWFSGKPSQSGWQLAGGVTYAAQQTDDYERRIELQRIGGEIVALSPEEWRVIAPR